MAIMNLLTGTQFTQHSFSEKKYHFNLPPWKNIVFTECTGQSELHFHDPVSSITLENCQFDNLIIHNQRMVGRIILKNCSGQIMFSSTTQQNLVIEILDNKDLNLGLQAFIVSQSVFEQCILQQSIQLSFKKCFLNNIHIKNQNISHIELYKCDGELLLESDNKNKIDTFDIVAKSKFIGNKSNFNIKGYEINNSSIATSSFILDSEQKISFQKNTITSFSINDKSFLLPYIQPWMNIIIFLVGLLILLNIGNIPGNLIKNSFIFFNIYNTFVLISLTETKIWKYIIGFVFFIFTGFLLSLSYIHITSIIALIFWCFLFANSTLPPLVLLWYNMVGSSGKIELKLEENNITLFSIAKNTFHSKYFILNTIYQIILGTINYFFNARLFHIYFVNNSIEKININNDGFSDEDKIMFLYEQPNIRITGINFNTLKESFFYKKIINFYDKRKIYFDIDGDNLFSMVFRMIYVFFIITLTSHFLRIKNLLLSLIIIVFIGHTLIFTHDNVTIKDNTVQLEILKSANHLCKTECSHYRNDKKDDKSDIAVPQFYDSYNSWYFTINELISLPLLETNKAFKPNNEHTELFSFIYHCLGLIYTSAFLFHLTKFILFKKAEVGIEEKEGD